MVLDTLLLVGFIENMTPPHFLRIHLFPLALRLARRVNKTHEVLDLQCFEAEAQFLCLFVFPNPKLFTKTRLFFKCHGNSTGESLFGYPGSFKPLPAKKKIYIYIFMLEPMI